MEKKSRKPRKKVTNEVATESPKTVEQIEKVVEQIKEPKKMVAAKMDKLVEEMSTIIREYRKDLNTASCANINKAIADLSRISKNLKR